MINGRENFDSSGKSLGSVHRRGNWYDGRPRAETAKAVICQPTGRERYLASSSLRTQGPITTDLNFAKAGATALA